MAQYNNLTDGNDPVSQLLHSRQLLRATGQDTTSLQDVQGAERNLQIDAYENTPLQHPLTPDDIRTIGAHQALRDALAEAGLHDLADQIPVEGVRAAGSQFTELGYSGTMAVRELYRDARHDVALEATRAATDGLSWWNQMLAKGLGSTPAQLALGGVDVLSRAQQSMFEVLRGNGGAALGRLFPTVVLEDLDENGVPREISPIAAAIDLAWSNLGIPMPTGQPGQFRYQRLFPEKHADALARSQKVNAEHMDGLLEFRDVVDSWFGKDNMDQLYFTLNSKGLPGQVSMFGLAVLYGIGEMFIDPLFLFEGAGRWATAGIRQGQSSVRQAKRAADLAAKTNRLPAAFDARNTALAHLEEAFTLHQKQPTEKSMQRLKNAAKLYADALDRVESFRRVGEVDTVNPQAVPRTKTDVVDTVAKTNRARTVDAPDARRSPYQLNVASPAVQERLQGLSDIAVLMAREDANNPADFVRRAFMGTYDEPGGLVTRDMWREVNPLYGTMFDLADEAGVHLELFRVADLPQDYIRFKGVSHTRLPIIGLAVGVDADDAAASVFNTFLHEMRHQAFNNLKPETQLELLAELERRGVNIPVYYHDLNVGTGDSYALLSGVGTADEFLARMITELGQFDDFWRELYKVMPDDVAEEVAKFQHRLMRAASDDIIAHAFRRPTTYYDESVGYHNIVGTAIAEQVREFDSLLRTRPALHAAVVADALVGLRGVANEIAGDIARITAMGRDPSSAQKALARVERHIQRVENDGLPALLAPGAGGSPGTLRVRYKDYQPASTEDLLEALAAQRRMAARSQTREVQPNREPTWYKEEGEWKVGTFEQADLFGERADRLANGPDVAESAAEGLGRMARGAEIDDVTLPTLSVYERAAETGGRIVPGTRESFIDTDALAAFVREREELAKAAQMELWEFDPEAGVLAGAVKDANGKNIPYDPSWLPAPRKTAQELADEKWFEHYQENFFDRIASATYPGSWGIKWPTLLVGTAAFIREPMRVLEMVDPGRSWPLMRNALYNAESETSRLKSVFHDAMHRFGALEYTDSPGVQRVRELAMTNAPKRERVSGEMSEKLFDILDTSPKDPKYAKLMDGLSDAQITAVADIRRELDLIAQRLGIPADKFIDGYVHHAFDPTWYARGGMLPENAGLSRSGATFLAALLDRNGMEGYTKDAVGVLDLYARGVSRKLHVEPALMRYRQRALDVVAADPSKSWYLKYADMFIAQIRGEPSTVGSLVDAMIAGISDARGIPYTPGAATRKIMGLTSLIYSSLLAGNRRYPVMSIATGLATTGAQFGMFRTLKAMFKMATPEGQMLFEAVGGSQMWGRIFEGDLMNNFTRTMSSARFAGPSIQDTENFIRGMTYWASIDETLAKGGFKNVKAADQAGMLEEILFEAMRTSEEVNHFFGVGAKPPVFSRLSRSGSVGASQFLSFAPKQTEQLIAMAGQDPGKILSYMMLSGWITRVAAQELGMDMHDYVGLNFLPRTVKGDMTAPGVQLLISGARMMAELNELGDAQGDPVAAMRAVEDFVKKSEVVVPLLRLAREGSQAAEITATGEKATPGLGFGREVDVKMGPGGFPVPGGPKGDRNEAMSIYTGARSYREAQHSWAKAKVQRAMNEATLERIELVEKAHRAMRDGDVVGMQKQLRRMSELGIPIADVSSALEARQEVQRLHWYVTEIKRNPALAPHIVEILRQAGVLDRSAPEGGPIEQ